MESHIRLLAQGVAELVFSPDYYGGPWCVSWRNGQKNCSSYGCAVAWVKYLRRNFVDGWTATVGKVMP